MDQKPTPFLWFDRNCEEAVNFYLSVFDDSRIVSIKKYPEGITEGPMAGFDGQVLTAIFELEGQRFMALDGGPIFKFNPSFSFFVRCKSVEEVDAIYEKLSPGGQVLMELASYPFSERYAWVQDKFGASWQVGYMGEEADFSQRIVPTLLFVTEEGARAEEAMNFYAEVFRNAPVEGASGSAQVLARYEEGEEPNTPGAVKYGSLVLNGIEFGAMDGSASMHKFSFSDVAVSLLVECENQEQIDYYWEKLSAVPEAEQCGWLKDKFGLSWQISPDMTKWMDGVDAEASNRATQAMLQMKKIDIATLERAYKNEL